MPTKPASTKPLYWVASSKTDLLEIPDGIQDVFGYALHLAQTGKKFGQAKPLKGFGSAGVLEVVEEWHGDAYRAVYTVKFASAVYVLHCFQKKSTKGIATRSPTWTRFKSDLRPQRHTQQEQNHDQDSRRQYQRLCRPRPRRCG